MSGEDTPEETPRRNPNLMPPWKPGQSGNPKGRPKGARSILQEDFFKALQADFAANGVQVLEIMRSEKPNEYARMIAGLMDKQITGEDGGPLVIERIESLIVDPANQDG